MPTQDERPQGPGLKWRKRRHAADVPYWCADPKAIAGGYPVRSVNLSIHAGDPARLVERATRLQAEMLAWLGRADTGPKYDGSLASIFEIYETDPESTYRGLKGTTRKTYDVPLRQMRPHIGGRRVDLCDGRDLKRWFADWRRDPDGSDHLPRARLNLSVLKAAISFGVVCRLKGCAEFKAVISELEFEAVPSRTFAPTAEQITAARKAAHDHGSPERALVYALQFETTVRQWDIIGQWLEMSDPKPSAIQARGKKWIGPTWAAIDQNKILRIKPTKTENTTAVEVRFDLSVCPMVMEELARHAGDFTGPMIVNPRTGLPYTYLAFNDGWRKDFRAAGLPKGMWNRDMRAGGVTEGGRSGASKDDRRKVAGHAREETTEIYDRDQLEAHRRVMQSRIAFRGKNIP
jgi:hypothetical protein